MTTVSGAEDVDSCSPAAPGFMKARAINVIATRCRILIPKSTGTELAFLPAAIPRWMTACTGQCGERRRLPAVCGDDEHLVDARFDAPFKGNHAPVWRPFRVRVLSWVVREPPLIAAVRV